MSFLEVTIGWLAPTACVGCGAEGPTLCIACNTSEILPFGEHCWNCTKLSLASKTCKTCRRNGSPNYVWLCTNYEQLAKKLVQSFKFSHLRAAAEPISELMVETLLAQNSDARLAKKDYLVVPVPTASSRIRQRSFDHTDLLTKKIATQLQLERKPILGRVGSTKQMGSSRAIRKAQVKGSYYVKNQTVLKGRNILLIDDVITTGATISEAARVLRKAGARSVDALVFAKRL